MYREFELQKENLRLRTNEALNLIKKGKLSKGAEIRGTKMLDRANEKVKETKKKFQTLSQEVDIPEVAKGEKWKDYYAKNFKGKRYEIPWYVQRGRRGVLYTGEDLPEREKEENWSRWLL